MGLLSPSSNHLKALIAMVGLRQRSRSWWRWQLCASCTSRIVLDSASSQWLLASLADGLVKDGSTDASVLYCAYHEDPITPISTCAAYFPASEPSCANEELAFCNTNKNPLRKYGPPSIDYASGMQVKGSQTVSSIQLVRYMMNWREFRKRPPLRGVIPSEPQSPICRMPERWPELAREAAVDVAIDTAFNWGDLEKRRKPT